MTSVECVGKHILISVKHEGVEYDCIFCDGVKNMFECDPPPPDGNWTLIENIVRDAAWNLEIKNLNELG